MYAVILAGGSGTRFWPASRKARPKQLLSLIGPRSLLRDTVERIRPFCGERLLIATGAHLRGATLADLPELSPEQLLIEPVPRNTAPCIAWAAWTIAQRDPDAVVMVLPSDAHIAKPDAYATALGHALERARQGVITTLGIRPTRPETGYGYIEAEPGSEAVLKVRRFVEKPTLERAQEFVASGRFFWNAGMFFFRATDMVRAIEQHLPELGAKLPELADEASVARVFPTLPSISIDHGVMEKVSELAVVPADLGWSDVGSWLAASELADRDDAGNSAPPGTALVRANDNHVVDLRVRAGKRVIALVGVSDLVVVETDDALLIARKDASQDVRDVVKLLEQRGDDELV